MFDGEDGDQDDALRSALTKRLSESRLFVIDDLAIGEYRTRKVLEILGRFELKGALLIDGRVRHRLP